jgi:hypothetical protein
MKRITWTVAAFLLILIIVASVSLVVINKVAGTRMGGMFG